MSGTCPSGKPWVGTNETAHHESEEEVRSERRRARPSRLRKLDLGLAAERRMWSDDACDNELDDIYSRLKKEAEYEAKMAEDREQRSDLPVLQDPRGTYHILDPSDRTAW